MQILMNTANSTPISSPMRTGASGGTDAVSDSLQKQINEKKRQLQELDKDEGLSPEQKAKKRQEIQQEISNLEMQKRQHEMEMKQKKREEQAQAQAEKQEERRTAEQAKQQTQRRAEEQAKQQAQRQAGEQAKMVAQRRAAEQAKNEVPKGTQTETDEPQDRNEKEEGKKGDVRHKNSDGDTARLSARGMKAMISAAKEMEMANVKEGIQTSLKGEAGVLEAEIKLDGGRGGSTDRKQKRLSQINAGMARLAGLSRLHLL